MSTGGLTFEEWLEKQNTTAPPIRMPAGLTIRPQTGDPLQDAMNLQADLAGLANNAQAKPEERQAAFNAYQAASDDVSRLTKERMAWNAEQGQLQAKLDAANTPEARQLAEMNLGAAKAKVSLAEQEAANYETPAQVMARQIATAIASRAPTQGRETVEEANAKAAYASRLRQEEDAYTSQLRREEFAAQQNKYAFALSNRLSAYEKIADMMKDPDNPMSVADAEAWRELIDANFVSAMKGTDPFSEQQEKDKVARERATIGKDILNQRLSSGTSVANTLMSGFQQSLPALGAGMGERGPVAFNPFQWSEDFATKMQGGPEVSEFGKSLLMGLGQGGVQTGGQPATPGQAAIHPNGLSMETMQMLQGAIERYKQQQLPAQVGVTP